MQFKRNWGPKNKIFRSEIFLWLYENLSWRQPWLWILSQKSLNWMSLLQLHIIYMAAKDTNDGRDNEHVPWLWSKMDISIKYPTINITIHPCRSLSLNFRHHCKFQTSCFRFQFTLLFGDWQRVEKNVGNCGSIFCWHIFFFCKNGNKFMATFHLWKY